MKVSRETLDAIEAARQEGRVVETASTRLPVESEKPLSEKEFMWKVIRIAEDRGWRVYHVHFSQRSAAGYPDLTMVRPHTRAQRGPKWSRIIFAELKGAKGKATTAQDEWLADLNAIGAETYIWKPCDLTEIERVLT